MDVDPTARLPRPFYDQWSRARRPAAHALWDWHAALADPQPGARNGAEGGQAAFFAAERDRAEAGEPLHLVPEPVCRAAYDACAEHGLDRSLLGVQAAAARALCAPTRFETADALKRFVGRWAVPHGRLLAGLAGIELSSRLRYVDELARGFFHLGRLLRLPRDVRDDRLFVPVEALRRKGVSLEQLRTGTLDEEETGLLWKESVRVRDGLAQGRPLMAALSLRHRFALKRFWLGALELLDALEERDYDLWDRPPTLSPLQRGRVYLLTLFGRSVSGR
jgi:phytoene synthase